MFKLTAPNNVTARIGGHVDYVWTVLGVAYTDRAETAEHLEARGYTVERVTEVPAEHAASVARLEAWPHPIKLSTPDGADPDQQYRFTGPDGHTQLDVRDLLSGALVLVESTNANHSPIPTLNGNAVA